MAEVITCPVCGHANPVDRLFCQQCIAPLNVQPLAALSPEDLHHALTNLLEVLLQQRRAAATATPPPDDRWIAYLNAFWLRPANALAHYQEARVMERHRARYEAAPFLEIGPGIGLHSALMHGWRFEPTFDAYQDLALDAPDVYDAPPQTMRAPAITRQGHRLEYGLDIKRSMVTRTRALGVFGLVMQGSAFALPLASGAIGTIYSNVIRDFDDARLSLALRECRRVLRPGGYLHLTAPNHRYREMLYYYPQARALEAAGDLDGARRAWYLDRGRHAFCAQQLAPEAWEAILSRHGFTLLEATCYAPPATLALWDTGWRPFTPLLALLAAEWRQSGALAALKPALVAGLAALLAPFLTDFITPNGGLMVLTAQANRNA